MFKLTLQDIALGWFETESPTWLTEDQMKQAFLKRFNPWGDTRRQQQDAWNKLKFDMTKCKVIRIGKRVQPDISKARQQVNIDRPRIQ